MNSMLFERTLNARDDARREHVLALANEGVRCQDELKADQLTSSAVGQINEYLNYFAAEVNDEYDNPPIGIILCTDKNNVRAQYALGGLDNAIFASTYTLRLPNVEQLEDQVRRTIEANERLILAEGTDDEPVAM
ncbi:MAG: PDDEXK nuclease domain-containing protein [Coriobacteriales bacterium]|nr:PDDEXK nuclease domain-containing protein [Coriobacteriales bacterium]